MQLRTFRCFSINVWFPRCSYEVLPRLKIKDKIKLQNWKKYLESHVRWLLFGVLRKIYHTHLRTKFFCLVLVVHAVIIIAMASFQLKIRRKLLRSNAWRQEVRDNSSKHFISSIYWDFSTAFWWKSAPNPYRSVRVNSLNRNQSCSLRFARYEENEEP